MSSAVEVISTSIVTLERTIINNCFSTERYYECQNCNCTEYYFLSDTKKLNTLFNIGALLKGVFFDLFAHNFRYAKISLPALCVHTCHCARNLSSPA